MTHPVDPIKYDVILQSVKPSGIRQRRHATNFCAELHEYCKKTSKTNFLRLTILVQKNVPVDKMQCLDTGQIF